MPGYPPQGSAMQNFPERFNPSISSPIKDGWIGDFFGRTTLTPTGWPLIYAIDNNGGNSSTFEAEFINLITGPIAGNDITLTMTGQTLRRDTYLGFIRNLSNIMDIYITFAVPLITLTEGFIGLHNSSSTLSALLTTAVHMGIYWDISVGPNFILSSSDGTQTTVNTTIAVDTAIHHLHIRWTGTNAATLELLNATGTIQGTTKTVSAINSQLSFYLKSFIQTETTAGRQLSIYSWIARIQ